ncbi:hypothetical protein E4T82_00210 [Streptococcus cuniculi]|uniref:Uncharacterized protein n=1 Tax=Streptococcus cuniculi TaxID=1432788 RepID=A0A4Y9JEW4_9STRE|nr:hypothetical protein E4T82_00210 [Streptococcus cuniculi]
MSLFAQSLGRVQLVKIRERLTRVSLVLSPTFHSLFLDCGSEHSKNRSFDAELQVLGKTIFFAQLVARVQLR